MMLFLGICKALKAMHQYRPPPAERMQIGGGPADEDNNTGRTRGKRTEEEEEGEQERPLMESENQVAQGGKKQSYAHRDIKPGM